MPKKLYESLYQCLLDKCTKRVKYVITSSSNVDDIVDVNDVNETLQMKIEAKIECNELEPIIQQ